MSESAPVRMNPLVRLLLFVFGVAVATVPIGVLLPDTAIQVLLQQYYSAELYDLTAPGLLLTWRWMLAGAGGLAICLALAILVAIARRGKRQRAKVVWPAPVRQVLEAVAIDDAEAVAEGCEQVARQCGDEAVQPLLQALQDARGDAVRRHLAATLYRLGRVVTAETSIRVRR